MFVDVESTLRRGCRVHEQDEAGQGGFSVPSAWVAGDVAGKPPPVNPDVPRLPEAAFSDDGVHLAPSSYAHLCRELARILEEQVRWGSASGRH